MNVARPDVAAALGPQFSQPGFNVIVSGRPPGRHRIVAFGRSLVTGAFTVAAAADVIVRWPHAGVRRAGLRGHAPGAGRRN